MLPSSCYAELVEQVETLKHEKHQLELKQKETEEQNKNIQKKLEGGCWFYYDNNYDKGREAA